MKLEHGDAFEVEYADWPRGRLPYYEPIWSTFIGHDGTGWPLPMKGLPAEKEQNRKRFYQAHYTFAVEAQQVDEITESVNARQGEVSNLQAFLGEQRCLILLVSSLGRIRDMFKIIDEALNMGGSLYEPMQGFYSLRSIVLHGPRLPVQIADKLLLIPKIATGQGSFGEWEDKGVWDDVTKFDYFADFCLRTRDELFKLIAGLHPKVYSAAMSYLDGHQVAEDKPPKTSLGSIFSGLDSGNVSAYCPPSGHRGR
jgi:hypothetical protein